MHGAVRREPDGNSWFNADRCIIYSYAAGLYDLFKLGCQIGEDAVPVLPLDSMLQCVLQLVGCSYVRQDCKPLTLERKQI